MSLKRKMKKARRLSDAELLFADLTTGDANAIPNIVCERLPKDVIITDVIRLYRHARYPSEKIFCCVCGARQHQVGFHVVRSDRVETTLGNCCAAKPEQLGKEYVAASMRSKEERERQGYLRTIHEFQPVALRIAREQMSQPWMDLARGLRKLRYDLRATLGQPWDFLRQAAVNGTALTAPHRVLLSSWGGGDELEQGPDADKDRYIWVANDMGRVVGTELFLDGDPTNIVYDLDHVVSNFRIIARDTDAHSTKELKQLVKLLRAASEGLSRLLNQKCAADQFFATGNLEFIAGWIRLNRNSHGHDFRHTFKVRSGGLINEVMNTAARKPQFAEPSTDLIRMLAVV